MIIVPYLQKTNNPTYHCLYSNKRRLILSITTSLLAIVSMTQILL